MCQYFSCIITKDLKVLWLPKNPRDHQAIIDKYKLEDNKLEDRDFVRIEITPKTNKITRNQKDWKLKIDEAATLPTWFNQAKATKLCFQAFKESAQMHIAIGNETKEVKSEEFIILTENSSAVLRDNSSAELWENSSAELRENSSAVLRENSSAELWENSSAVLRDNSSAELWDNSSAELISEMSVAMKDRKIYVRNILKIVEVKDGKVP